MNTSVQPRQLIFKPIDLAFIGNDLQHAFENKRLKQDDALFAPIIKRSSFRMLSSLLSICCHTLIILSTLLVPQVLFPNIIELPAIIVEVESLEEAAPLSEPIVQKTVDVEPNLSPMQMAESQVQPIKDVVLPQATEIIRPATQIQSKDKQAHSPNLILTSAVSHIKHIEKPVHQVKQQTKNRHKTAVATHFLTPKARAFAIDSDATVSSQSRADYGVFILAQINTHKFYPPAAREQNSTGAVGVAFSISRSGRVSSVSVTRSSGSTALDNAAKQAVYAVNAPPPPDGNFSGSTNIRFNLSR